MDWNGRLERGKETYVETVITACCSRHDNDFHVIHRRLGPESDHVKQPVSSTVHSALAPVLRGFPHLTGSGAGYPGIVICWDIEWRWHLLKKLRC